MDVTSAVGVLLKVGLGSYSLALTATKAINVSFDVDPVFGAHEMAKQSGFTGLLALLGCLGLGLVFLSLACGIMFGAGAMVLVRRSGFNNFLSMGLTGLAIILGSEICGAILGSNLLTVMNMGSRGLCVMGVLLSLLVYPSRQQITRSTVTSETGLLLTLLFLVFLTMAIGVLLGIIMSGGPGKILFPIFFLAAITLLPPEGYMTFLIEMVLGKSSTMESWIAFERLVTFAGYLFGWGALASNTMYPSDPSYQQIATALHSLVHTLTLLAGIVGSVLGTILVSSLEAGTVEQLSLWTSVMMAGLLNIIEGEVTGIHGGIFLDRYLGVGGAVGLQLGTAGMAGLSLGVSGVSISKQHPFLGVTLAITGAVCGTILGAQALTLVDITTTLGATLTAVMVNSLMKPVDRTRRRDGHEIIPMFEAAQSSAALGMLMVGAMVLGGAGLFTADLGTAGFYGTIVASFNMIYLALELRKAHTP